MELCVLGAGAMGSALTVPLAERGHGVRLWGTEFDAPIMERLWRGEPHPALGVPLPRGVQLFDSYEEALSGADSAVLAVSSEGVAAVARLLAPHAPPLVISVAKGLYVAGGRVGRLSQLVGRTLRKSRLVVVGGPSIAREVATLVPTATLFASSNTAASGAAVRAFTTKNYRPSPARDVAGVELCSALKNVYAIALGAAEGLERSRNLQMENLKALLFTAALGEMARFARRCGGERETAYGLAGAGDLEVSVRGGRNARFGALLGSGLSPKEAQESVGATVEGYATAKLAAALGTQLRIGAPLLETIHAILFRTRGAEAGLLEFATAYRGRASSTRRRGG